MRSVVHVVTTANFAGVERYVCTVARETAARGWDVTVVGGHAEKMPAELGGVARWLPGATMLESLRVLAHVGRRDLCHAHLTLAEAVAVAARPIHRAPVVSTRHIAAPRGSTVAGRVLAPWIGARLAREVAVSDFVAGQLERPPQAVVRSGVVASRRLWRPENKVVLVLQRLEAEKDTWTALRAWEASGMCEEGWRLRIVGDGSERRALETWAVCEGLDAVEFAGWSSNVPGELAKAGIFLASASAESFGLAVVEAMAAGVPIVASATGGHLETVGRLPNPALFPPADAAAAGRALRSFLPEAARAAASRDGRRLVEAEFTIVRHVDDLLLEYEQAMRASRRSRLRGRRQRVPEPT